MLNSLGVTGWCRPWKCTRSSCRSCSRNTTRKGYLAPLLILLLIPNALSDHSKGPYFGCTIKQFASFDAAADEYFSKLEAQRQDQRWVSLDTSRCNWQLSHCSVIIA